MQLSKVIQECWQIAEDHGFHNPRTFGDTIALAHSELSEALEAYRTSEHRIWYEVDGKPEGTAVELADAVIRIFDTALDQCKVTAEIFTELIISKMEYNRRREYRHGGRKL